MRSTFNSASTLLQIIMRSYSAKKTKSVLFRILKSAFYDENPIALIRNHLVFCRSNNEIKRIFNIDTFLPNYRYFQNTIHPTISPALRRDIILFHQSAIQKILKYNIQNRMSIIWQEELGGHKCTVTVGISSNNYLESELEFSLKMDSTEIYHLSCMICQGFSLNLDQNVVIFIGRVQGVADQKDKIRHLSRLCHGISPMTILLTVIQGFAIAVKAESICGLRAIYHPYQNNSGLVMDYDKMWHDIGSICEVGEYHSVRLPIAQKPLSDIAPQHRRRARKRRVFKNRIINIVTAALT